MIYYTETKVGRKSIYKKVVTDEAGKVLSEREVEIPLYKIDKDGRTYFLLYDNDMNVLSLPSSYLNFNMTDASLNTRKGSANALRILYVFLSLSNYDVRHLEQEQLNELVRFLQGLNSNPDTFKTETTRSNDTVNGYLSVYRSFFRKKSIRSSALFDAKITRQEVTYGNDFSGAVERIQYTNNLRTTDPNAHTVPKYISPSEFEQLYKLAIAKKDARAMIIMRLMYCYGLRLGEVLGLTMEDLHETHRDNALVPTLILRNRLSDKDYQYAKNLGHVDKPETYRSKEYAKAKAVIVIDYPLYEMIFDYISDVHPVEMEKHKKNYDAGVADIVSWRDAPEYNHYIFLSDVGTPLSGQTWGNYLKPYFIEAGIDLDLGYRENNLSHRFRHGFAMLHAHYRKEPVSALQLQLMMRHKSLSSTMKYYNPTQEEEFKIKEEFAAELETLIPSLKEGVELFEQ